MRELIGDWRFGLSVAIGVCVAAGLVLAVDEIVWLRRRKKLTHARVREMLLSLSPLPLNIAVTIAMSSVWGALYVQAQSGAIQSIPINALTLVGALLAVDLSYYWEHRCAHRLPWLWGLYHAIHHSSEDYTIATAYRVSFVNQIFSPAFYLPWIVLGFHPLLIAGLQLLAFHYQAWLHTEMIETLGIFDRWFNTPAAHRMHHSAAIEHRDRNLGAITLLWDRVFGTYAQTCADVCYGIPGVRPPRTLLALYVDPWRRWLPWANSKRV